MVSEYEFVEGVAICTPLRNTLYPVTPTLSVAAVHVTLTCVGEIALAETPVGTEGAVVSPATTPVYAYAPMSHAVLPERAFVPMVAPAPTPVGLSLSSCETPSEVRFTPA